MFRIIAITVGFSLALIFFFVPETFWDRTPHPKKHHHDHHLISGVRSAISHLLTPNSHKHHIDAIETHATENPEAVQAVTGPSKAGFASDGPGQGTIAQRRLKRAATQHVGFAEVPALKVHGADSASPDIEEDANAKPPATNESEYGGVYGARTPAPRDQHLGVPRTTPAAATGESSDPEHLDGWRVRPQGDAPKTPALHNLNSPSYEGPSPRPSETDEKYGGVYGATTPARATHNLEIPASSAPASDLTDDDPSEPAHRHAWRVQPLGDAPKTPALHNFNSPSYAQEPSGSGPSTGTEGASSATASTAPLQSAPSEATSTTVDPESGRPAPTHDTPHPLRHTDTEGAPSVAGTLNYTRHLQTAPPKTFRETLRPWHGRLRRDAWLRVAARPFVLFAYPAILWATLVYSLSIGWLIVLSEAVAEVYRSQHTYNFTALQAGLVYLSPFVGGVLGTAVAGKLSDVIVRFMARRNDGVYEPEFRLVMALPVLVSTAVGLMGFGWSVEERDAWIVPTVFFGVISFGCSLGSTTAITFAVDSYRQYAGEALVTLNFSKSEFPSPLFAPSIPVDFLFDPLCGRWDVWLTPWTFLDVFHGFVFSLFFPGWLEADGPRSVFLALGGIQVACLLTTVPMYIYGKRLRMWTVRRNMMERF